MSHFRKEELRAHIQRAAREVFSAKGYAETKISDIARKAEISPSTIYLYFSGKRDLFASLGIPEAEEKRPEFQKKRQEIAQLALVIFGRKGFEGTTMEDIAAAAGFSKAALYQYYQSKEDLFLHVLHLYTESLPLKVEIAGEESADWRQVITALAHSYLEHSRDPARNAFLGSVLRDSTRYPMFGRAYYEQSFRSTHSALLRYLRPFQESGGIRRDVNLEMSVFNFLTALTGYIILFHSIQGIPMEVDEGAYLQELCQGLIHHLEPQSGTD